MLVLPCILLHLVYFYLSCSYCRFCDSNHGKLFCTCGLVALILIPFVFPGLSYLYPGDIIPFTRRPLFLIVDSDNSHAFKAGLSKLVHDLPGSVFCSTEEHSF